MSEEGGWARGSGRGLELVFHAEAFAFYHAGCPVCLDAESAVTRYLDSARGNLEVVHVGTAKHRVDEAESAGV